MDDKVSFTVVGAFVLVLGAALVAAVLWLAAGVTGKKQVDTYQSIIRESVAGLNVDAPVKYLGVDVGKVTRIGIDPQNSRQVRLLLAIEHGTPLKEDTEAVLKTQGLTGIAYVELSGGSAGSPPLAKPEDGSLATIASKPSLSARLENVATNVLGNVDRVSNNINAVMDADNRAALRAALADIAALARALAAQQGAIGSAITDAARTARQTARATEQLGGAIERIAAAGSAVERMAQTASLATSNAGRSVDAAASGVQQIGSELLPEATALLGELNRLSSSLRQLVEQTERQPSSLLLGRPTRVPGPGETSR